MKKIMSLAVCILVLFSLCTPVFAGNEERLEEIKPFINSAVSCKDAKDYLNAGDYYFNAAGAIDHIAEYYTLAAHIYGLSAECYTSHGHAENAARSFERQAECIKKAAGRNDQVSVNEVFNDDRLIEMSGSTISEGNITIIVGVAAAVVFGLGGFFLGRKKKHAATDSEN